MERRQLPCLDLRLMRRPELKNEMYVIVQQAKLRLI